MFEEMLELVDHLPALRALQLDLSALPENEQRLCDEYCHAVAAQTQIEWLNLIGFLGVTRLGMESFARMSRLRGLRFYHCAVGDQESRPLANHPRLVNLQFEHCPITDRTVELLGSPASLRALSLAGTRVSDAAVAALASAAPCLEVLDLRECGGVTSASLPRLCDLHHLRRLDLTKTGVSDTMAASLSSCLTNCKITSGPGRQINRIEAAIADALIDPLRQAVRAAHEGKEMARTMRSHQRGRLH
jgi:hypothetical protein